MDTPQEPSGARIVPFPQQPAPSEPSRQPATDQLLDVVTLADTMGVSHAGAGTAGVAHMRAVSIGASSGAFYPHTPTEQIPTLAATLGIRSVELMLQTASEYQSAFIDQVAANAQAAGVRVHSIHTMHNLHPMFDSYPRRAQDGRALFQQGIEAAAKLGAKVLVWHGAHRQEVVTEEGWERFIQLTRELAHACGEAGVTLAIENVSWCALAQVRHVVQFATRLNEIGTPGEIGFVFDPFQAVEAGANPFMMLAAMGNRIVDVHISDYRAQDPAARHLAPGDGDLPWSALIRAIAGSGYSGPMMIEGPLGADDIAIERIRQHLNPLIRSVFNFQPDANREDAGIPDTSIGNDNRERDEGVGDADADIPGTGDRETESITLLSTTTPPAGILQGIELFNARQFYAQHEAIEHEWHAERGPIRRLYQGILQIGVGFHHALNGNQPGAVRLLGDGIAKTSEFAPQALGIETGRLVRESQRCLDTIVALGPARIGDFDPASIPTIAFTTD